MSGSLFQKIRQHLKNAFDRVNNQAYKRTILQAIPFWIASVLTGLIAVAYAELFGLAESVSKIIISYAPWALFILMPFCFLLAWWIVLRYAPNAKGSGIPQVIAAIEITGAKTEDKVDRLLSVKIIIVKIASSLIMAAGGGAIGREGPTIQIASSLFRKVNELLPPWWPKIARKNMITTGAAAGLAAAFNTPLGGIVFAIEELTKTHFSYFKTAIFSSVIIAGLTAQAIIGPYLYLGYPKVSEASKLIFLAIVLVAVLAGMLGAIMSKLILWGMKWKAKLKFTHQHVLYIGAVALVLGTLATLVSYDVLGSGKEIMQHTLFTDSKYLPWYTPVLRVIGPVLSFTTGAAGGIFAPSLASGASIGSVLSGWMELSESNTNLMILSGMVGFLTGVTRSPFTSAILVLEMTDRHGVIFHLILAAMTSSVAAILIDKHSFYHHLKNQYIADLQTDDPPTRS
ncbi:chloride channel protein [Pedobacter deserti]|uniref:chloride channel protein n=1 Tax=Pedobacter deserti TaxID=2817382 RepID=UPI00210889EA|nr:chloride channel protein [Pedobacter sp. SYSU D00382]